VTVLAKIRARHAALLEMPASIRPSQWAARYRYLSREAHSSGGKYQNWPFQVEPVDELINPLVRGVVLQWASQLTGKTELVNNATGYFIQHRPRPILNIQYSLDMARVWVKDRLNPMLRDTPILRGLVHDGRSRMGPEMSTMLVKIFPGGRLAIVGAESEAGLASRPIGFLVGDEADKWMPNTGGDPWAQARKRLESFPDAVWLLVSSPKIRGKSRIEKAIEGSDKRFWFVPCYHCGQFFVMQWEHIRWPKDKPELACLECPVCARMSDDRQRIDSIHAGQWRATAPFNGIRGYTLNGIVTMLKAGRGFQNRLHQMADEFLTAKKEGPLSLQVWTNLFKAETWEEELDKPEPPEVLYARRENYGTADGITLPERCVVLAAGADVQADRIEAEISGWGEGEESWGVEYRVFRGNIAQWKVWDEFEQWLVQSRFRHVSGHDLGVAIVGVDQGHNGKMVYAWCNRYAPRAVIAIKGVGTSGLPWVTSSKRRSRLRLAKVNTAKELIYSRLKLIDHGPGYCHFPETYTLEYFQQLTSERMRTVYKGGVPVREFIQNGRNESIDCRVYGMAGIETLRPNYKKLALRLKNPVPIEEKPDPNADLTPEEKSNLAQIINSKPALPIRKPARKPTGWMRF